MKSEIGFLSITTIAMINTFVDEFNAGIVNIMRAQNHLQALWLAKDIAQRRPQTAVFLRDRWGPLGNGDEELLKRFVRPKKPIR